jgi:hypothetical protein
MTANKRSFGYDMADITPHLSEIRTIITQLSLEGPTAADALNRVLCRHSNSHDFKFDKKFLMRG